MDQKFKLKNKEAISPVPVINLSNHFLKTEEINLLAKGLQFIPKPNKPNLETVKNAMQDFSRRLKLTTYFEYLRRYEQVDNPYIKFRDKSDWTPSDKHLDDETLAKLSKLLVDVNKIDLKQIGKNMSKVDYRALKSLRNRKDIVIKPADKGSSTIVLNKSDYIFEAMRQLSDPNYYKKLEKPVYPNLSSKFNNILDQLLEMELLDQKQIDYLCVKENPRNRLFYLLPKIHKDRMSWKNDNKIPPGRPIVSDCGSDTYRISEYIDSFLQPLATIHSSYIKDTYHFLSKLNQINPPQNSYLVTIDVESLYTNINNNDGLIAVQEAFSNNPDINRSDSHILNLLKLCLNNNDFEFNNEWFLQISGTAMGKKFAPNYANLFLAKWEQEALEKCPKKPSCYLRFLDDIFIIWPHSKQEFNEFFQILNSHHSSINLKASIESIKINFLDVTIFKGNNFYKNGKLDTKVYFKPTDSRQLLHKTSYHPKHTFKSIIKSQILRYYRICSNKNDFESACKSLFQSLKPRGYSGRFLRTIKTQTLSSFRCSVSSKKCKKPKCLTCPFLTETDHVISNKDAIIPIKHSLNCHSKRVVYVIKCKNCDIMYVGQTRQELHERFTEHRSTINTGKAKPVAKHFTQTCPGIENLSIMPVEQVPIRDHNEFMGLTSGRDILSLNICEQKWMAKLKTLVPNGLNLRQELPPPIPFVIHYSDQAAQISKLVRDFYYDRRSKWCSPYGKYGLVTAFKRNKNLKDYLIHAKL